MEHSKKLSESWNQTDISPVQTYMTYKHICLRDGYQTLDERGSITAILLQSILPKDCIKRKKGRIR